MKFNSDDIRTYQFQKAGMSGYKATDVDELLDEIAKDYDEMAALKAEFAEKIQVLADKINEYRESEDSVKTAILHAQRTGDAIYNERKTSADEYYNKTVAQADEKLRVANEKAEKIVSEAQEKAQGIVDRSSMESQKMLSRAQERTRKLTKEANEQLSEQRDLYNKLKSSVESYKISLLESCQKYITTLKDMPLSESTADKIVNNDDNFKLPVMEAETDENDAEKKVDEPTEIFNIITDSELTDKD